MASIYSHVPYRPDPFGAGRRRAHQRQRVEEVPGGHARRRLGHLRRHGPGSHQGRIPRPRRLRRLHGRRRRRRHEGGGQPLRHPGHPADHARLDRSHPSSRPDCSSSPASPSSTRSTSRTATPPAPASTASCRMAREYGAAVVCTCIDTEGQARTADWKLRAAQAIHDLAVGRYGLAPEDLLFDPLVLPITTGMEESRRDGIETIEGIRRIKSELPGVGTIVGLSNVSFGLNPSARHALNSVFLHECQEAGLDAAIVHAARIIPLHKIDPRVVEVCLDLIYDRRDPGQRLRPAGRAAPSVRRRGGLGAGDRGSQRLAGRSPPEPAHHRRRPGRSGGRSGRRPRRGVGRARRRQRSVAGGHEGGRRPVRFRSDAVAVRAAIGGDHEGGGGLPGAAHGEGRRRRQGPHRARHRQGRRARHRQEPGRHHLHQQRLRGPQSRHQGAPSPTCSTRPGRWAPTPSACPACW